MPRGWWLCAEDIQVGEVAVVQEPRQNLVCTTVAVGADVGAGIFSFT